MLVPRSLNTMLILLAPVLSVGCEKGPVSPSIPKTAPVRGTVLYKGAPIADVRVTFHPTSTSAQKDWLVYGTTDNQGKFIVGTGGAGNGAPPGEYQVTFKLVTIDVGPESGGIETERDGWKGRYLVVSEGPKVQITDGDNQLEPFRLE